MMFGLGTLGTKLIIAGIVVAVISTAVGGFFLYQKSIVSDLQDKIDFQAEEITTLTGNVIKLKASNESLELQATKKAAETKAAYAEITRLRVVDSESTARVNEVESILRDSNRNKQLDSVRKSKRASFLLRLMDLDATCQVVNFDNVNGKCVRGKWVPKGERVIELEVKSDEK